MSWMDVKLGDVCIEKGIQTGPFGSQLHQADYSEVGTPVVMPVDLVDGGISTSRITRVSEEHVRRLARHKLKKGDIVYARRGDVGRCSHVKANEEGWLCGTGCLKLTYDPGKVDSDFLYYALSNPDVVGWVRNHAVGATMPNLNTGILESVPLRIPSGLKEQNHIAEVLSAYDSLIENNRRQIKLLEEAAQRLYKEWFVELRFPGYETTPIINGLPEGWERVSVGDCLSCEIGGGWGEASSTGEFTEVGYVIRATDINSIRYGDISSVPLRWHKKSNVDNRALSKGDIVFEVSGGSKEHGVGRMLRVTDDMLDGFGCSVICASFCKRMTPKNDTVSALLFANLNYEFHSDGLRRYEKRSAGNIINYHWDEFLDNHFILTPSRELVEQFVETVLSFEKAAGLCMKRIALAREARDRLLPKLMSGEIEI